MSLLETNEVPKKRLQFDMPQPEYERLLWLMHACGMTANKDLLNNALTVFEWAVNEVGAGREVGAMDKRTKEFTLLSLPIFDSASEIIPKYRDAVQTRSNESTAL